MIPETVLNGFRAEAALYPWLKPGVNERTELLQERMTLSSKIVNYRTESGSDRVHPLKIGSKTDERKP